ncbi:Hypothetical protein SMAX5B_019053 [Scophthalmus maximus]|uniref:Uncharacterized protein n=1 Tax=Scophthalmus maximus TaxID=52904 RepID=A0A2U9C7G4_SCOMX|nr:Hypothetical protein SMAX5B_019053 [Scophthalmus maximus]
MRRGKKNNRQNGAPVSLQHAEQSGSKAAGSQCRAGFGVSVGFPYRLRRPALLRQLYLPAGNPDTGRY